MHNQGSGEENYLLDCITLLVSNIMFDPTDAEYIDYKLKRQVEDRCIKNIYLIGC